MYLIDKYTFFHFIVGMLMCFLGISIEVWHLVHIILKLFEYTSVGYNVIHTYFKGVWPDRKATSHTIDYALVDLVFGILGWYFMYYISEGIKK